MGDLYGLAIDYQASRALLHPSRKNTMGGVELGQVRHAGQVGRLVDGYDLEEAFERRFVQRPEQASAYAAITIDCQTYRAAHGAFSILLKMVTLPCLVHAGQEQDTAYILNFTT